MDIALNSCMLSSRSHDFRGNAYFSLELKDCGFLLAFDVWVTLCNVGTSNHPKVKAIFLLLPLQNTKNQN